MTTECSVTDPKNLRQVPKQLGMAAAGYTQKKRTRQEPKTLSEIKSRAIDEALSAFGNHKRKAAERLGISQATLFRHLQKLEGRSPKKAKVKRVNWSGFYQKLADRGFTDTLGGAEYRHRTADLIAQKIITDEQGDAVTDYPDADDSKLFITRGDARRELARHLDEFADLLR
jgi:hypothetical protein